MKLKKRLTQVAVTYTTFALLASQITYGTEITNYLEPVVEDMTQVVEYESKEEIQEPERKDELINDTENQEDEIIEEDKEVEVEEEEELPPEVVEPDQEIEENVGEATEEVIGEKTDEATEEITEEMLVEIRQEFQGANYADGIYIGEGIGYNSQVKIRLSVTIYDGEIINIEILQQDETPSYWERCKALIQYIKEMRNPAISDIENISVDVVTGASENSKTCSGIRSAMIDALSKAVVDEDNIFASGEGTSTSPYIIGNKYQLQNFSKSVSEGESYEGIYIKLLDDIELSGIEWQPIGNAQTPFKGYFNGNNNSIIGMKIGSSENPADVEQAGFFGNLGENAQISNLTIEDAQIYVTSESGTKVYAGGLVGYSNKYNKINKCEVKESRIVVNTAEEQFIYIGGLVGNLGQNSIITNSMADTDIEAVSGNNCYVGGLAGITNNKALVMNNQTSGKGRAQIISTGKNSAKAVIGGTVGMAAGIIYNCYADYEVEAINEKNAENIQQAGSVSWCTGNGAVFNCLYNGESGEGVIIFPEGQTIASENIDIQDKNLEEIRSLLNKNLADSFIKGAQQALEENEVTANKDFAFAENVANCTFYSWEVEGDKVSLTQNIWRPEFNPSEIFEGGTGTKEDPYLLKTEEQLRKFATSLSDTQTYNGQYVALMNDIKVSDECWTPIGEGEYCFCGTFDGNGYTIGGIRIKDENDTQYILSPGEMYFGLFGVIGQGGTVKNLGVIDVDIDVRGKNSTVVGGVAGLNDRGIIDSCYVTGSLRGQTTTAGNNYAGGLVGWGFKGYVVNSYTDAKVYSSVLPTALSMAGGLVGMTNRTVVANCYSLGTATGHSERKLEEVESMAAVGGLIGVAGSPVVNCYTSSNTISEDYSYYVGATVGWGTGIAQLYNLYYSQDALQMINSEKISPISDIGWLVGPGVNEEGEVYGGALTADVISKNQEEMQLLATQLNSNLEAFPLDNNTLPENTLLKKWTVKDGSVTFSDEYATRTYVAPSVDKPALKGDYYNGIFYGRALNVDGESYLQVTVEVENKQISKITSDIKVEGMEAVIKEVITTQEAAEIEESDSADMVSFKSALRTAIVRALKGDFTDYNPVNPQIFAGGEGSLENPYKISTAEQLVKFAASVNEVESFKGKYICLTNDIDLQGIAWIPVGGNGLYPFSGTFDGKGFEVKNMCIGSETIGTNYTSVGLFAHLDEATIRNLGITNAFIHNNQVTIPNITSSKVYVGLIAGYAGKISTLGSRGVVIDQCYGSGKIISESVEHNYVGGLVGSLVHSAMTNSYAECNIEANTPGNWIYAGGLVGLPSFSVLANNYAYGEINTVSAVNKSQLGGIGGMHASYSFNNYAEVKLQAQKQTINIGALAGTNSGVAYMEKCYGNANTEQQAGDKLSTAIAGSIVNGTRYGKGQVVDCTLQSTVDNNLIATLNTNKEEIKMQQWYKELVEAWAVYMPEDVTFNSWELNNNSIAFAKKVENNTGSSGNNGSSSDDDKPSSGGTSSGGSSNNKQEINTEVEQSPSTTAEKVFTDVKKDSWYYEAVQFVNQKQLMKGVSEDEFAPDLKATRGMLVTILHNMEGNPIAVAQHNFIDVKATDWFMEAVAWGKANNIINGVSEKEFRPKNNITREQLVVLIYQYAQFKNYDLIEKADLSQFKDSPSAWAEEAMKWAVANGIMQGKGQGILDPQGECTRAEVAQMMMNFLKKFNS